MKPAQRPLVISARYGSAGELLKRIQIAEQLGADQVWLEQAPDQRDAIALAAGFLVTAPAVTVGTAVLPVYARHPVAMAQAAATLAELSEGRFILGLGLSHPYVNEHILGLRPGPPIAAMREYLSIVRSLLDEGVVTFEGRFFTARAQYVNPRPRVPIYLGALRPQMIRLAVEFGDGILLWLCPARYVREHVIPAVRKACRELGRDAEAFPVMAMLPANVGDDVSGQVGDWRKAIRAYRLVPYYRYVLDRFEGLDPEGVTLLGDREQVRKRVAEYREAGCVPVPLPLVDTKDQFIRTLEAIYD